MTRTKMLLAVVTSGLALTGIGVPTAMALTGSQTAVTAASPARGENGNGRGVDRACSYPATRSSNLALSASASSTPKGAPARLLGQMAANGCPVKQGQIVLYSSASASGPFTVVPGGQTTTDNTGNFFFTVTPTTTTYYRVAYAGGTTLDPVVSNVVRITVTVKK